MLAYLFSVLDWPVRSQGTPAGVKAQENAMSVYGGNGLSAGDLWN